MLLRNLGSGAASCRDSTGPPASRGIEKLFSEVRLAGEQARVQRPHLTGLVLVANREDSQPIPFEAPVDYPIRQLAQQNRQASRRRPDTYL